MNISVLTLLKNNPCQVHSCKPLTTDPKPWLQLCHLLGESCSISNLTSHSGTISRDKIHSVCCYYICTESTHICAILLVQTLDWTVWLGARVAVQLGCSWTRAREQTRATTSSATVSPLGNTINGHHVCLTPCSHASPHNTTQMSKVRTTIILTKACSVIAFPQNN